ncbi:ATP-dependent DNA helicase MER3 [Golovinomyces cichoracearum]|uniref:DNA 3'-5' helicase n=1 Tax=Golovinomyces cichoracearum TaxID=62708 RepID=A0A420HDR7_9PEZI|nr:ATP-dependent DNA helicase MER3 [Golovinomyces cichoracearum]
MNPGPDSSSQNILQNANTYNMEEPLPNFNYKPDQSSPSNWSFEPYRRMSISKPTPLGLGRNSQYQSSSRANFGPNRISLMPQSFYKNEKNKTEGMYNSDFYFRFEQNLRQGTPPGLTHWRDSPYRSDTVTQLANAMLLHQPLSQMREPVADYEPQGIATRKFFGNPSLQFQGHQAPAIFTPSNCFTSSSKSRSTSTASSSPFAAPLSSPTLGISLRRENSRRVAPSRYQVIDTNNEINEYLDPIRPPHLLTEKPTPYSQNLVLRHAPPMAQGIRLISPYELPDRIRQTFPYELFNAVQSKCFGSIYNTLDNLIVSAPTGSGKTVLLELAVCKLVESCNEQFKIVYLAPTKSLCSERLRDWQKKFSHLNLTCAELTGDTNQSEMARVRNASIIVTTPEKWDSITRKWSDHHRLVQMVKLFLIDEVHILKDIRGATLEAVVSRMKAIGAQLRFIALSATIPNSEDIAIWLGKDHCNQHLPAHRETFGESFRPVKLQKHVHGFDGTFNDYAFDKFLDGKLTSLLQKYTHRKPMMIFCFTRKSCEATASILSSWWDRQLVNDRAWLAPSRKIVVENKDLQNVITCGVAFHHAGLDSQDRHAIEIGYLKGDINVICCTSTLAVGVNLPCHLVVLKGTVGFQDGVLREYSDLEVMQMLGRAGRPQFDENAVAIIMTRSDKVNHYNQMISGQDILESTLHLNLIEHLNSEINLGSVKDLYQARTWITKTFLSVRMRKNPKYYKIPDITEGGDTDERLEKVCERDITLLQAHGLVRNEERFGCTEYGEAMCRYMVQFETMKLLLSIPKQASMDQILAIICQAIEFKDLRIKSTERSCLRQLNKSPFIKFPIEETISTFCHKVSLVIQIQLGGVQYQEEKEFGAFRRQFSTDKNVIFERIQRLIRCVIDCKVFDRDATSLRHALDLSRSISAEYWDNSNLQLRQIPQIGPVAHRKLCQAGINTIERFATLDTASIERILSKNPPFGKKMKDILASFPHLNISAKVIEKIPVKVGANPQVRVKCVLGYNNNETPVWNNKKPCIVFMAETSAGELCHFWRGIITKLDKGLELNFTVTLATLDETIKCYVTCEEIVGTLKYCSLRHDIPSSDFPRSNSELEVHSKNRVKVNVFNNSDEFGIDELEDEEFLAIAKSLERSESEDKSDGFTDISFFDEEPCSMTLSQRKTSSDHRVKEIIESTQMDNGKWTCQHECRDGRLRKNGQKCKHRCCHEGVDRPHKIKQKSSNIKNPTKKEIWKENINDPNSTRKDHLKPEQQECLAGPSQWTREILKPNTERKQKSKQIKTSGDEVEIIDLTDDSPLFLPTELSTSEAISTENEIFRRSTGQRDELSCDPDFNLDESTSQLSIFNDYYDMQTSIAKYPPSFEAISSSQTLDSNREILNDIHAENAVLDETIKASGLGINSRHKSASIDEPSELQPRLTDKIYRAKDTTENVEERNIISRIFSDDDDHPSRTRNNSIKRKRTDSPDTSKSAPQLNKQKCHTPNRYTTESIRSVPDWVEEFDADLIEELKDYVDFVE